MESSKLEIPQLIARFLIYGDTHRDTYKDQTPPTPELITKKLGIEPTTASHIDGVLIWEYCLPEQESWDTHLALYRVLEIFDATKIAQLRFEYPLEVQVSVVAYVTDGLPALDFPSFVISKIADLKADLDIDIIKTAK